jgi:hypothetical protein
MHGLHALLNRKKAMKKISKLLEIRRLARVRNKATDDYYEAMEFAASSTDRSRLELSRLQPASVVANRLATASNSLQH